VLWFWLLVVPALLLTLASVAKERARAAYVRDKLGATLSYAPPASVIVPVKGEDEGLRENLAALRSLDYPDYELLIAAHSARDIPGGVLPPRAKIVLAHGGEPQASEKVQNLMAAVHAARPESQVFAFADSDGRVTKRWLRALVEPLADEGVGAATGYRWFLPEPAGFWSLLRAVWDAVAAGMLGPGDNPFAWGGAMAITKRCFLDASVFEAWKDAISDDYSLTSAVHRAGWPIAYAPGALTPSPEHICVGGLLAWTRRQMMITRTYNRRMWGQGLAAHFFYCGAMAASVYEASRGAHWLGIVALGSLLVPGMWKGRRRAALARLCLPEYGYWFRRYKWAHTLLVPVATWLWLSALLSSAFGSTIEWRGYRYDLRNTDKAHRV
jgi:ceramide glucosyltransferase